MRTIVETPTFAKIADHLMGETCLEELKDQLARHPDAGGLNAKTGGFRKIRGKQVGIGKRGGVRVFYYPCKSKHRPIYLVMCVAKADDESLSDAQCKWLAETAKEFDTANVVPLKGGVA